MISLRMLPSVVFWTLHALDLPVSQRSALSFYFMDGETRDGEVKDQTCKRS